MNPKTLADLISHLPNAHFSPTIAATTTQINHVTADSRQVRVGSLFVAVAGDSFDGHRFIPAAIEQGAAAIIGTKDQSEIAVTVPYIRVAHSRSALAICAAALHDFPSRDMTVIGVTGTDGKTTTSTILESILVAATREETFPHGRVGVITTVGARVCGNAIDTGFHVTTPDAPDVQAFLAQMRDAGCVVAIVESTSHGLAQERVSAIDFDVACVTNITHEHLDWHGSRSAYIAAKALLFRMLFYDDITGSARSTGESISDALRRRAQSAESFVPRQSMERDDLAHDDLVGANPCGRPRRAGARPAPTRDSRTGDRFAVLNMDDVENFAGEGSYPALMAVLEEEFAKPSDHTSTKLSDHTSAKLSDHSGVRIVRYGIGDDVDIRAADIRAVEIATRPDRTVFELLWEGGSVPVETGLIGDFNVQNILCAASVALSLGVGPSAIQDGVAELKGVVGRMERIDVGQPFLAIVDFAHSPASLERALLTLRRLLHDASKEHAAGTRLVDGRELAHVEPATEPPTGPERGEADGTGQGWREPKLIAVFGCAGLRDVEKRRLMGQVSGRLADFTIITAEDPRTEDLAEINAAIAGGVREFAAEDAFCVVPDRAEAIALAVAMARAGDVVAAFGKGHERTICFGETEYPWSDQDALRDALRARFA